MSAIDPQTATIYKQTLKILISNSKPTQSIARKPRKTKVEPEENQEDIKKDSKQEIDHEYHLFEANEPEKSEVSSKPKVTPKKNKKKKGKGRH